MSTPMTKDDIPRSSGIFKPVGHVVLVMRDAQSAEQARQALAGAGFDDRAVIAYTSEEMRLQCEEDLAGAGALASLGAEISLSRKHLELAREGACFLVVHVPEEEQVKQVTRIAEQTGAMFAQLYGRLTVEELVHTEESPRA